MAPALARHTSRPRALGWLAALPAAACASLGPPAAPGVAAAARATSSYAAELRVRLDGPELRARTAALVAFRRPDGLRVEIPGPAGPRLVVVARSGRLVAVFASERAVFEGAAEPGELEKLLGIGLSPEEMMDLLVGIGSPRLSEYRVGWGPKLPGRIEAKLPDGGRLRVTIEQPEAGVALRDEAFLPPPHAGYRRIDAREARTLWSR
ncbi:MAG: hypothetical protein AB7O37_21755 [Vicinamibacteria bacterium]